MDRKGQSEAEAIAAIAIAGIIFLAVLAFNSQKTAEIEFSKDYYGKAAFCREVSSIISQMGYLEGKQQITAKANYDFNIIGGRIFLENYSCNFQGNVNEVNVMKGTFVAREDDGVVEISNQ